jgi:hypothetical protein
LQVSLRDTLLSLGVFAFDIRKFPSHNRFTGQTNYFAILTLPSASSGKLFLQLHGSQGQRKALQPLYFRNPRDQRNHPLEFRRSNTRELDPLKIKSLQEKQEAEEAKRSKLGSQAPVTRLERPGGSTLSFLTLMTGVWDYDGLGRLVFDQKFKDGRRGYITFGKNTLVVSVSLYLVYKHLYSYSPTQIYLRAETAGVFNWHCRIDIDYAIIEHIIPSYGNGQHGTMTFTLKSPPKFYDIQSTNDLHLYSGGQAPKDISSAFAELNIKPPRSALRLERLCKLSELRDKNSALCMVYKIAFPDIRSVGLALNFVRSFPAVHSVDRRKIMEPITPRCSIEDEYAIFEKMLSDYGPSIPATFTFKIRYQLTVLVLEGMIAPRKMEKLIPYVQRIAELYGEDLTASAVRGLGKRLPTPTPEPKAAGFTASVTGRRRRQTPTPAPAVDAENFMISNLKRILDESIECCQRLEEISRGLDVKQKKYHHLALTYKATVTPTGTWAVNVVDQATKVTF